MAYSSASATVAGSAGNVLGQTEPARAPEATTCVFINSQGHVLSKGGSSLPASVVEVGAGAPPGKTGHEVDPVCSMWILWRTSSDVRVSLILDKESVPKRK